MQNCSLGKLDNALSRKVSLAAAVGVLASLLVFQAPLFGQSGPNTGAGKPIDLTGYWVSVVTTLDWRFRMVIPPRGDFFGIHLTPAAIRAANGWDPAKDEAAGEQCKSYGAGGIMLIPSRLHIVQQGAQTLRIDIDAGTQTRLLHFGDWKAPAGIATWQGDSLAQWDSSGAGGLKVVTRHMRPGYVRRNGVPYSENAVITEYFDVVRQRNGDRRLILTMEVADPMNLQQPYATSVQFKKEADGKGWNPTACSARW